MKGQPSQTVSNASPVEFQDLRRQMTEVLDLRAKLAFLEKVRTNIGQQADKASDVCTEERRT
jgi:hypothetical protein